MPPHGYLRVEEPVQRDGWTAFTQGQLLSMTGTMQIHPMYSIQGSSSPRGKQVWIHCLRVDAAAFGSLSKSGVGSAGLVPTYPPR